MAERSVGITLEGFSKRFGKTAAVSDVTLTIDEGEFFSLLGPRGCGKTTRTAMVAGGLLAFALSWDEVVVTIFTSGAEQTLPIWIFSNLFRPVEQPIMNVVALFVIVVSIIPVWLAPRLTDEFRSVAGGHG
jgi:hypothetical protein